MHHRAATPDTKQDNACDGEPDRTSHAAHPALADETSPLRRLELLGSALAARSISVADAGAGELAWTDGKTIYLDAAASAKERLLTLAVQASLIAAGSLDADIASKLTRRPALMRRYLVVEAVRALRTNAALLPPTAATLTTGHDHGSSCAADSLDIARRDTAIADPPPRFGTIRARRLLDQRHDDATKTAAQEHIPRNDRTGPLDELADDGADDGSDLDDPFSSPVGGSGPLGRLFAKLTSSVRKLNGNGSPGSDAPTHRTRAGVRGAHAVVSRAQSGMFDDEPGEMTGYRYPEWDVYRRQYREQWCTVNETLPELKHENARPVGDLGLRRPLARLGVGLQHCHRQAQGDDIDIDAAIEARIEAIAGSSPNEAVYLDTVRRRRDLGVLVLLDVSASAAEPGTAGRTVHEQQRATAAALTQALHELGDRIALYAFASKGRSSVNVMPIKRFHDHMDGAVHDRLYGLVPGAYSRLGAAIRHGSSVLEEKSGTTRRLLVVISDGLAYDLGYERDYGAADARRALAEARRRGTGCLCLTVGADTDVTELQRVFGSAAHATITRPDKLAGIAGPLFHAAIKSAEARRRRSQRETRALSVAQPTSPLGEAVTSRRGDQYSGSTPTHPDSRRFHDIEGALQR